MKKYAPVHPLSTGLPRVRRLEDVGECSEDLGLVLGSEELTEHQRQHEHDPNQRENDEMTNAQSDRAIEDLTKAERPQGRSFHDGGWFGDGSKASARDAHRIVALSGQESRLRSARASRRSGSRPRRRSPERALRDVVEPRASRKDVPWEGTQPAAHAARTRRGARARRA